MGDSPSTTPDASTGDGGGGGDAGTDTSTTDSATDAPSTDAVVDGPADAAGPACDPNKPFAAPTPLVQVNTANIDEEARISATGLELFVTSYATGPNQPRKIQRYTRASLQAPWTFQSTLNELSISSDGGATTSATALTLRSDGLTGFYQWYDAPPSTNASIGVTTRASIGGTWAKPTTVTGIDSNYSDESPWLSGDGQRLYFFSSRAGGFHTLVATKAVNGFNTPQALLSLGDDRYPVLTGDELTLYIGSYGAPPDGGANSMNVLVATRASIQDNFSTPKYVPELNVPGSFSAPSWVSPDGCTILLFGQRPNSANFDIYTATKPL